MFRLSCGCKGGCFAAVCWAMLVSGCQTGPTSMLTATGAKPTSGGDKALSPKQVADVKIALAHAMEQRGEVAAARAAYLDALHLDSTRADACERVAVLFDQEGKFEESAPWYDKARKGRGNNPEFHCNQGYSFYLQGRWTEAEASLRCAVGLAPDHPRSHVNLGLVLVQQGREKDALAEFHKGGCNESEARTNLAFALTLRGDWPEARNQYEQALAVDPNSARARNGLQQVSSLIAKCDPVAPTGRATALTKSAAAPSSVSPVGWQAPTTPGK